MLQTLTPRTIDVMAAAASTTNHVPEKFLYSRKEAAFALGISVRSLDSLIATKQLATRRLGKKVMLPSAELRRFSKGDHFHLNTRPVSVT